jgi:YesN/AraC family two-component response regulator
MPEMDGLELLRIFKKAYSKDIPIIMVSSSEDPDTIQECFRSGAEDFLQKPIRFEMLKRRVEMCLDDRLRRRKETMYQEMLRKERENRNRLSKQVEEQEKELQQIKSQISDTIETPMQVVMKTIGDLMEGNYSVEQYKGALVAILKSLGSRDLYKPAFSMLLEKGNVDDTTRKWLQSEFMNESQEMSVKTGRSHSHALISPIVPSSTTTISSIPDMKQPRVVHFSKYRTWIV